MPCVSICLMTKNGTLKVGKDMLKVNHLQTYGQCVLLAGTDRHTIEIIRCQALIRTSLHLITELSKVASRINESNGIQQTIAVLQWHVVKLVDGHCLLPDQAAIESLQM